MSLLFIAYCSCMALWFTLIGVYSSSHYSTTTKGIEGLFAVNCIMTVSLLLCSLVLRNAFTASFKPFPADFSLACVNYRYSYIFRSNWESQSRFHDISLIIFCLPAAVNIPSYIFIVCAGTIPSPCQQVLSTCFNCAEGLVSSRALFKALPLSL